MVQVIIDQDITPTSRLLTQLPDSWETTVGIDNDEYARQIAGYDVALVTSRIPFSPELIEQTSQLEAIGKLGTGIDSIDLEAAEDNDISVTHTPGHNALSVAEHTLCLTLATLRRLTAARELIATDRWRDEYPLGSTLSGSTVGIVGFGDVGKRVGTLLSGFDVEILASDPYVPSIDTELVGGEGASLGTLLKESDVVILTAELTDETRHIIDQRELSIMDSSAILINTGRGPLVREDALLDALSSNSIAGAGLDVFSTEPLGSDSELLELDTVVTTPHVAAMTTEARSENIDQLASNVTRIMDGERLSERYIATAKK
ncbi:NAD(P)-dependent oxidoreductase [Halostagnicola sp. A-GB9-2]|uniref:NAD(P)-dependent oxidoreductase n=1 Tax=Halostagnicola sp. A-GB9-2 TaxID=3048066 RepID=UPI0024C06B94|nr:NAD(P)-dependent oxidoreductase [Halostagnicola sp. A-GB9-2]MDJ1434358.1 NAD(P)-dependent oxidoreductase [Halostagnicola sp. A-GB9-2]